MTTAQGEFLSIDHDDPLLLFRYRSLAGEARDWVKEIIVDSKLYLANPTTFNDPFDSRVHFSPDLSEKELERKGAELLRREYGLCRQQSRQAIRKANPPYDVQEFLAHMRRVVQQAVDRLCMLSMSSDPSNILMWSHYADCHRGICLVFDRNGLQPPFAEVLQVVYHEKFPLLDVFAGYDVIAKSLFQAKARDWSYEREWRAIDFDNRGLKLDFVPRALVGLIFGARTLSADMEEVRSWTRGRKEPLAFYQAKICDDRYGVRIVRV